MNKDLQIELFSCLLDHYSTDRVLDLYKRITDIIVEEEKLNNMSSSQKAIYEANSNPEDGPQCRLDKYVLGECGQNESSIYYESGKM